MRQGGMIVPKSSRQRMCMHLVSSLLSTSRMRKRFEAKSAAPGNRKTSRSGHGLSADHMRTCHLSPSKASKIQGPRAGTRAGPRRGEGGDGRVDEDRPRRARRADRGARRAHRRAHQLHERRHLAPRVDDRRDGSGLGRVKNNPGHQIVRLRRGTAPRAQCGDCPGSQSCGFCRACGRTRPPSGVPAPPLEVASEPLCHQLYNKRT